MKLAVLTVSALLGLAQAADPAHPMSGHTQNANMKFGFYNFADAATTDKKIKLIDNCQVAATAAETGNCPAGTPCHMVIDEKASGTLAFCNQKRALFTGYNREKTEDAAWCPTDGCPAWFGMAHVTLHNQAFDGTSKTAIFNTGVNYAGQAAFKKICPFLCKSSGVIKRCVTAATDCKVTAVAPATLKTDTIDKVYMWTTANEADTTLNVTSCPGCADATCPDKTLHATDKSKCKTDAECSHACNYYKFVECNSILRNVGKTEKDVGACVDPKMTAIGCKHHTNDDKCMPAAPTTSTTTTTPTGGASTAGGIAGALMAVAVALLQ
eukprot:GHVU01187475.1.p1 GENE.GHVU01187475.1~~GHVU01187475.1.p1  ORF type:complete len:325 (+),score=46.10 GHVU01187475.1:1-975(+)